MRLIDKQRIRSGYYRRKRERAYKQSSFINYLMGLIFIVGGVFNEGTPGGTLFMFAIGILMFWCGWIDGKGIPTKKTSPFSEAWWKNTNKSRRGAGLKPFTRPDNIPAPLANKSHIEPFPTGTLMVIIALIIAVLIFHQVKVVPYMEANKGKQPIKKSGERGVCR